MAEVIINVCIMVSLTGAVTFAVWRHGTRDHVHIALKMITRGILAVLAFQILLGLALVLLTADLRAAGLCAAAVSGVWLLASIVAVLFGHPTMICAALGT